MKNDWRRYTEEDDDEEQDPRKVLQEEFDFLARNWDKYLLAAAMSFIAVGVFLAVFISFLGLVLGGHW